MIKLKNAVKHLRTKTHYFMLLDALYSFLEENEIPFEEFEVFIRKSYRPNDEFISKLCKIF